MKEEIEKLAFKSFKWKLNKQGEPIITPVGQINPNGWRKHLTSFTSGYKACEESYNGISPATVAEMVEALRDTQKHHGTTFKINEVIRKIESELSKADKELKG